MEKERIEVLVHRAQNGDLQAMEQLLEAAHTPVSYQCRKMMPRPEDAQDLTQEILLAVYQNIGKLEEPKAFWSWLNRITVTRCMNALTRTHVDLQFAEDEDGHSVLDVLEETDEQSIPDKAIDNAETARMIDEIVSNLPEAQRLSTLMYYYDEMSVKEIAQIMGVSENTVKSRLNLARKAIKEKVQNYEKQGVKLYSVSVLPFLWYFLRKAAITEADVGATTTYASSVMAAGAVVEGAATAGGAVAHFAVGKVVAMIIASVVTLGGIFVGAIIAVNQFCRPVPTTICQHEWSEANCINPRICCKCDSTEGAAIGHDWQDADCKTPMTCRSCGDIKGESLGHTWVDATCEAARTCCVCEATEGEALGHTALISKAVAATCEEPGLTEGSHCSRCGVVISKQIVVSATGHSWGSWKVTTEPTATSEGAEQRTCKTCGNIDSRSIAKLSEGTKPAYETFSGTIGSYNAHNLAYTDWKGDTEQAAYIEIYTVEKNDEVLNALAVEFEKVYGFAPSLGDKYRCTSSCEKMGTYMVAGYEEPQTVYHYSITDKTYIYITNPMYEVYVQEADDGSVWVGYCIYATMDTIGEERSKAEVQALDQEMYATFEKLIGLSWSEMNAYKEELDLRMGYISEAGTVRSVHSDKPVQVLYIYCRGFAYNDSNG